MGRPIFLLSLLFVWMMTQSAEAPMTESSEYPPLLMTTTESIAILDDARSAMFEKDLDRADELLDQLWRRKDGMMAAVYHRTEIAMTRALKSDGQGDYDQFFEESDRLRDLLRRAPMSAGIDYLSAESARQRFFVFARRGENFKAALALKASYSKLEDLIERHPAYYEAYKTMGLLHVTLATLPETYRSLLKMVGLAGSLEQGSDELSLAATQSRYGAKESAEYLSIIARYDARYNLATSPDTAMSRLRDTYRGRQFMGLIYGDMFHGSAILARIAKSSRGARSRGANSGGANSWEAGSLIGTLDRDGLIPTLPDQRQLLSGNYGAGVPVLYWSGE